MSYLEVVILALIEGLTEYLPVSSTGHLIVASAFLGLSEDEFVKSFNIIIQSGAIFSVLLLYWRRFLLTRENKSFFIKLAVAFLPAAVIGLLVKKKIDLVLGSVTIVAASLIIGGIILVFSERIFKSTENGKKIEELTLADCLKLGFIQCLAFIPGVSRSAATILGGLGLGLGRKEATEFSFFLAVPTLIGASVVKGVGAAKIIQADQWSLLALGTFLAFIFALLAIRYFITLVSRYGFKHFGIYRILIGIIILLMQSRGLL